MDIIVKSKTKDYRKFYGPLDKGSSKPSFCYPSQKEKLAEEIKGIERALKDGYVAPTRVLKTEQDLKEKNRRLDEINHQESEARKAFDADKDYWISRRNELGEKIAEAMPSISDVNKRHVNPHRVFENEKKKGLEEMKREYQVISHLADEESNTKFLQRD